MTRTRTVLWLVVVQFAVQGCGPVRTAPATAPAASGSATAAALPTEIRWVQNSAEYEAIARQVYRQAENAVEEAAAGRGPGTRGVVLDADETVISNLTYPRERAERGLTYSPESWAAWVARKAATPLPGARAFLDRVRELGGRIAIVTNRLGSECDDTEAVLALHNLPYDAIFCRPDGAPGDKNPRFEQAAVALAAAGQPPVSLLAFVGDNIHDFPGQSQALKGADDEAFSVFGSRFFLIPNPMYGSWQ